MSVCGNGHEIRLPKDRLPSGACAACNREAQKRYARRQRAGMALLAAVEGRGMQIGEAIALIQRADYWTIQKCQGE